MTEFISLENERKQREATERIILASVGGSSRTSRISVYLDEFSDKFIVCARSFIELSKAAANSVQEWIQHNPASVVLLVVLLLSIAVHVSTAMSMKSSMDVHCSHWMADAERVRWKTLNVTLDKKMTDLTAQMQVVSWDMSSMGTAIIAMIWMIAGLIVIGAANAAFVVIMYGSIQKQIRMAKWK